MRRFEGPWSLGSSGAQEFRGLEALELIGFSGLGLSGL